jgi:hypothetical protein
MALTAPIFTKIANVERHYVEIPHTEFHPSRSRNTGSRGINLFRPVNRVGLRNSIFMKLTIVGQPFAKNSYTAFHENRTNRAVAFRRQRQGDYVKIFLEFQGAALSRRHNNNGEVELRRTFPEEVNRLN